LDPAATPLRRTPILDELLKRLRRRLVVAVWLHGLGRTLACAAAWLALIFALDWWLHLPGGLRALQTALLAALPLLVLWRELVARLRRIPDRAGLALLIERGHHSLHELLVSAVQLAEGRGDDRDSALVAEVLAAAEARAAARAHSPRSQLQRTPLPGRFLPILTDFSDFLGRLQPSKTTIHKTPNTLGVEESSSPRRVLHF